MPSTPAPDVPLGPFMGDNVARATENSLEELFAAESLATFQQPWQKLDRGSRLDRLRKFVTAYPNISAKPDCTNQQIESIGPNLSPAERASLLTAVLQAFELRQLNTKVAVEYDAATATVLSIRGLKERTTTSGLKTFRIDNAPPATRTTQKQRKAPAGPNDLNTPSV